MLFAKLVRTDGKGDLLLSGGLVVAVFETKGQTVIRTAAGGENASFVVSETAEDVAEKLSSLGVKLVQFTRNKDGGAIQFNVAQIVAVYQRTDNAVIRTTAGGEHAEYVVAEAMSTAVDVVAAAMAEKQQEAPNEEAMVTSLVGREPKRSKGSRR
ncbi:hypothetical protein ASG68_28810 [Rhizobium sp. Leaf453]|nr:hypothetical protein ASG50_25730 [Rhizobium sp. Leaf386]KQS95643.1 hypothetical protein ASG42_29465 [Rhizobium sp. Leaf391]KQU01870.1 hypothetical protein ASG68_28810 [Rhizobium sp. Leaf453]